MRTSPIDSISKLDTEKDYEDEEIYSERFIDEPANKSAIKNEQSSPHIQPQNISVSAVSSQQTISGGALGIQMTGPAVIKETGSHKEADKIKQAKLKGYTGDICQSCGSLTMVRNGTCLKCITCGDTSGCS